MLAPEFSQYQKLIHRLVVWADVTSLRVPDIDFYNTVNGKQMGFEARSLAV